MITTRTKTLIWLGCAWLAISAAQASDAMHDHGNALFHGATLELEGGDARRDSVFKWKLDGWIGGDTNKLRVKAEGQKTADALEKSELWAMYSRNIDTFWDVQAGLRHDTIPESTSYAVVGFAGLAPYHIETAAHTFLSDEGDVSARLHLETGLLFTQKLVLQPHAEINIYAQDVPDLDVAKGIADAEGGLQLRYELTRDIAPYIDVTHETKFGETADIAKRHGELADDTVFSLGLRLQF